MTAQGFSPPQAAGFQPQRLGVSCGCQFKDLTIVNIRGMLMP
jgi:hypothetical protein